MPQVFTVRSDRWLGRLAVGVALASAMAVAGVYYYGTPEYTRVGYAPRQPVPFSHALHAGQLKLSCLYCHTGVEESPTAQIPSTRTCMNCHLAIKPDSPQLAVVRESWSTGKPIPWVRVHQTPDYVYFNHAAHVTRGVGCISCHGRVDRMAVMVHEKPLSMGWCLDCHRHPAEHLRPPHEATNLDWLPPAGFSPLEYGKVLKEQSHVHPPEQCSGCHR